MRVVFSPLGALLSSQFLSSFVDNTLLFIAQAILLRDHYPDYYLPVVQAMYLASYIIASPWVGGIADYVPKARVLLIGNALKALCSIGFLFGWNPALSYSLFGLGSVLYSPAKYGILPFLTHEEDELVKANSWMEGTTIAAILCGSLAGGYLSDYSIGLASVLGLAIYAMSAVLTFMIPLNQGCGHLPGKAVLQEFWQDIVFMMKHVDSRFSVIASAFFWTVSNILKLALFVWVPQALCLNGNSKVSLMMALIGVGIGIGAGLAPRIVSIRSYRRTIVFGLAMGIVVIGLSFVHTVPLASILIFIIGVFGGLYIVPINSLNEYVGERSIGAGRSVTIQNFAENIFMLAGTGAYSLAEAGQVPIESTIHACGVALIGFMIFLTHFRRGAPLLREKKIKLQQE